MARSFVQLTATPAAKEVTNHSSSAAKSREPEILKGFGTGSLSLGTMANAGKHMGPGAQGKRSGTEALTELREGVLGENMVLSNRDKSRHTDQRGLDSATVQTEQYHDHVGDQRKFNSLNKPPESPVDE
jgi:hypothetical protein